MQGLLSNVMSARKQAIQPNPVAHHVVSAKFLATTSQFAEKLLKRRSLHSSLSSS